jgi:hypothetical protein
MVQGYTEWCLQVSTGSELGTGTGRGTPCPIYGEETTYVFDCLKMIHFDFIVSDEEAENIFDAINQQIFESQNTVLFGEDKHKEWHRGRVLFLQELLGKMTNSKIS